MDAINTRPKKTPIEGYVCVHCGNVPVWLTGYNKRRLGHIRELHCPKCGLVNGNFLRKDQYNVLALEKFAEHKADRKAKLLAAAEKKGDIRRI